jgi:hypothetical protein
LSDYATGDRHPVVRAIYHWPLRGVMVSEGSETPTRSCALVSPSGESRWSSAENSIAGYSAPLGLVDSDQMA